MTRLKYIYVLLLLICLISSSKAGLVVNEVMANEPGGQTTLEWIEIYNNSTFLIEKLYTYRLRIGPTQISLYSADSLTLGPGDYFIVCSRLYASGSTPGFESFWGDSSGTWGDTPYEQSFQTPYDVTFSLANNSGTVELLNLFNQVVSSLHWSQAGLDGYSWERELPTSPTIGQSEDPKHSTPGYINSITPMNSDLSIDSILVSKADEQTQLLFYIDNRGLTTVTGGTIELIQYIQGDLEAQIDIIDIGDLEPDFSALISRLYTFNSVYASLEARLPYDDRLSNNILSFVAPGVLYPPLILTEIMSAPTGTLNSEWVEIYNRSGETVDLNDWKIGDENNLAEIADASTLFLSGTYIVLAESLVEFLRFYPNFDGIVIEPLSWPPLNNDGDIVRLIDNYDILADQFAYDSSFGNNNSWARLTSNIESEWGRSAEIGGTPGDENSGLIAPDDERLELSIYPARFSPDGDGFEEFTVFTLKAPEAIGYKLRVYDRDGRLVRTLLNGDPWIQPSYEWNGYSDDGKRLPIGIYIVHFEATGIESVKRPVVIAR